MTDRRGAQLSLVVAFFGFALRLLMATPMRSPFLFYDEMTGPAVARWIAGDPGDIFGVSGQPLYGLLLAPLAVLADPDLLFRGALVFNAACYSALAPLLYRIGREVLSAKPRAALGGAAVGSLTAASFAFSSMIVPEGLLALLITASVLAAHRTQTTSARWPLPLVIGLAVLTHSRSLVLVVAILGALAVATIVGSITLRLAAQVVGGVLTSAVVAVAVAAGVRSAVYVESSPVGTTPLALVTDGFDQPLLVARSIIGTSWYLTASTAGFAIVGVLILVRRALKSPGNLANLYLALTLLGTMALSALFVSGVMRSDGRRVDAFTYGRYVEVLLPLLILAAVAQWSGDRQYRFWASASAVVVILCGALVASLVYDDRFWFGPNAQSNMSGMHWMNPFNAPLAVDRLWWIAAAATVGVGAASRLREPTIALATVLSLAVFSGYQFTDGWARVVSSDAKEDAQVAEVLTSLGVTQLTIPLDTIGPLQLQLVTFWTPEIDVQLSATAAGLDESVGSFVLTSTDALNERADVEKVLDEPTGDLSLWRIVR